MEKENLSYISPTAIIDKEAIIEPFCYIEDNVVIKKNAIIKSYSKIINSIIEENSIIESSHIENSHIKQNVKVGPFAKIRDNSILENNSVIGNFVEIKKSIIGENSKVKHLSYIGDAFIGKNCNIGCGVVFANYDGKEKHQSIIRNNVFIGCNSIIIAPIKIENNCYICAGTVIHEDVKENTFVIGRAKAILKENRAKFYLKEFFENS